MNNNLPPNKVKYENVFPFPFSLSESVRIAEGIGEGLSLEERVAQLERLAISSLNAAAALQGAVASLQNTIANQSNRSEIKVPLEAPKLPESRPLPEEDKIVDRYALCADLVRVLTDLNRETVLVCLPKLAHGDKTDKPRVYFTDDNSFLYFDKWGRIYPGAPTRKCKGKTARYILGKLHEMRDFLPSHPIQAALAKSQFNAAII
jgi:hypothetical protein